MPASALMSGSIRMYSVDVSLATATEYSVHTSRSTYLPTSSILNVLRSTPYGVGSAYSWPSPTLLLPSI